MKFWPYVLLAIGVAILLFFVLAFTTGILQEILGAFSIVLFLAAIVTGVVLWIRFKNHSTALTEQKTDRKKEQSAHRELKQMEKAIRKKSS